MLHCTLERKKDFFGFKSTYKLKISNNQSFLLCAEKKTTMTLKSYYHISMYEDVYEKSKGFVGKLRSDSEGMCYNIYSNGLSPVDAKLEKFIRDEFGSIFYKNKDKTEKGNPRPLSLIIPYAYDDLRVQFKPYIGFSPLYNCYQFSKTEDTFIFENKKP